MLGYFVEIYRGCVTVAAVGNEALGFAECVLNVRCLVHGKHGGELLVGELLGELDALDFADEYLRALRNGYSRKLCDSESRLTDYLGVECAVYKNGLSDFLGLLGVEEVASASRKLRLDCVVDILMNYNGLLRGADHAVIEGLGVDYRVDREDDIRRLVDYSGRVACADADCGLAGGICRLDHSGAAGGENYIRLFHNEVRHLKARSVDPFYNTLGSAGLNRCVEDNLCRGRGRLLGARMGADDDSVSRFEGKQALEYGGGGRVGRGDDRSDNADGLGYLLYAVCLVLFNYTTGFCVFIGIINIFCSVVVLYDLVLNYAHAGLLNRHLCKRYSRLICGGSGGEENFIYLLLGVSRKLLLCLFERSESGLECFNAVDDFSFVVHDFYPPKRFTVLSVFSGVRAREPCFHIGSRHPRVL